METERGNLLIKYLLCFLVQCSVLCCTGDREDFSCALGEAISAAVSQTNNYEVTAKQVVTIKGNVLAIPSPK